MVAAAWYRKAAEKNYAKAMYNLGAVYRFGQGVPKDEATAAEWLLKAAGKGESVSLSVSLSVCLSVCL